MKSNLLVRTQRTFKKPADRVWKALTTPDALARWFFEVAEFRAEVGFIFRFVGTKEGVSYPSTCTITKVEPGRLIAYTWVFDGFDAVTHVTWELIPRGEETLLTITHGGLENLPQDHPHFAISQFSSGWQYFEQRLEDFLAGH